MSDAISPGRDAASLGVDSSRGGADLRRSARVGSRETAALETLAAVGAGPG